MAIDNLGRDAGDLPVKSLVRGLSQNVTDVMQQNTAQSSNKLDSLLQATNNVASAIGENIGESIRAAQNYAQQIIQTHQKVFSAENRANSKQQKEQISLSKNTTELIRKIYNMGKTPRTFWVGVGTIHPNALASIKKVLADCGLCRGGSRAAEAVEKAAMNRAAANGGKGGGSGGGGGGGVGGVMTAMGDSDGGVGGVMAGGGSKMLVAAGLLTSAFSMLAGTANQLRKAFGVDVLDAFNGVLSESNAVRMQVRELVFQTRGFGDENREIEQSYRLQGSIVRETGVALGQLETMHLANLKRGLAMEAASTEEGLSQNQILERRLKTAKNTMKIGVHTATQLGMSVSGMNQMFMDWRMHLGMGVHEMHQMGNAMKTVARSTGVTGEELEKAVQASAQIMRTMKSAGTLSAGAAKSVLSMMTAAQKYGMEEQVGEMMKALTGGMNAFDSADGTLQNFLLNAAAITKDENLSRKTRFGQVSNSEDISKLTGGMEEYITRITGLTDADAQNLGFEKFDITNLSAILQEMKDSGQADKAAGLEAVIKNVTGKEVGDIVNFVKGLREGNQANKTYSERIEDLQKKMSDMADAGLQGSKAYKELDRQLSEVNTQKLQDGFNEYVKILEERGNIGPQAIMEELTEELTKTMGPEAAKEFAANISSQANELLSDLSKRAKSSGANFEALLKEQGVNQDQLSKMLSSGNKEQIKQASDIMNDLSMAIAKQESTTQDPITDIQQGVKEANAWLRDIANNISFAMSATMLKIIFWLSQTSGLLSSIFGFFVGGNLFSGLSGAFSKAFTRAMGQGQGPIGATGRGIMSATRSTSQGRSMLQGGRSLLESGKNLSQGIVRGITQEFQPFIKGFTRAQSQNAGIFRAVTRGVSGQAISASHGVGFLGKAFTKVLGPLTIAIGGLTGALEAETEGRTKTEGALLGMLTGDASTGSMFSGMLGVEKGSAGDKTLGVLGATAWGGMAGAAIGAFLAPFTAGISIPAAAAIGAAVGAIAEIIKIVTEGTTLFADIVDGVLAPLWFIWDGISGTLGGLWRILKGIVSFDLGEIIKGMFDWVWAWPKAFLNYFGRIINGLLAIPKILWRGITMLAKAFWNFIKSIPSQLYSAATYIANTIWETIAGALSGLAEVGSFVWEAAKFVLIKIPTFLFNAFVSAFIDFPIWLAGKITDAIKFVFVELPQWIGERIMKGLNWLSNIEWIQPLLEPFKDLWATVKDLGSAIAEPFIELGNVVSEIFSSIGKAFEPLINLFTEIKVALFGASEETSFLSGALSFVTFSLKVVTTVIGFLIKVALFPLVAVIKTVTGVISLLVKAFSWLLNFALWPVKKAIELVGSAVNYMVVGAKETWNFLKGLGAMLWEAISSIPGMLWDAISSVGSLMLDGLKAQFIDFPMWLFGTITDGLANLGTWIWDHTIGAIINMIPDWIKNMFGGESVRKDEGGGSVVGEASETLSDITGGAGRATFGAGSKLIQGDVVGATGEVIGGMADMMIGAFDGVWDTGKAVLGAINPLNWFEQGTREIAESGVAMVHEGEMIVPKNVWEKVAAVGSGAFGSGGGIVDGFMSLMNPFNAIPKIVDLTNPFNWFGGKKKSNVEDTETPDLFGVLNAIHGLLNTISESLGEASTKHQTQNNQIVSMMNAGAFEQESSSKANESSNSNKGIVDFIKAGFDAYSNVIEKLGTAIFGKQEKDKKTTVAEPGKGLYYDLDKPMTSDTYAQAQKVIAEQSTIAKSDAKKGYEAVAGTGLDYRDQIKGQVSVMGSTIAEAERRVAQEKAYESQGSSTALGMGGVEGILQEEVALMQMMYETLIAIKENTSIKAATKVVGTQGGNPPPKSIGVKSTAKDYVRGNWDINHHEMSPASVTNDGRGGN